MERKVVKNTIAFPSALYDRVKELAEQEHRSIAQQVVYLCEYAIKNLYPPKNSA